MNKGYDCPKCDACTGFSESNEPDVSWLICDSCGYEDYASNFKLINYGEDK